MYPAMSVKAAEALVDTLRQLAAHIESNGPAAYLSGGVVIDFEQETYDLHDSLSGRVVRRLCGPRTINVKSDLALRGGVSYAPSLGIKQTICAGIRYQWDGEPPRAPKRGDFYLSSDAPTWVSRATRDLKRPRHIMQKCS